MATAINVSSQDHWHDLRSQTVGASEIASLFGCGYESLYSLWHRKAGKLQSLNNDSQRIKWGNRLEPVIAKGIADEGLKIEKVHQYLKHKTVDGMGASLDYRVIAHEAGPGAFEIKNVDSLIFRQKFEQVEDGRVEAPPHIELQLQHQLAVTGYKWGMIGVLVGGNDPKLIRRSRIPSVIEVIEQKITEFWDSIKKGDEPKITEEADFKTFEKLFNPSETLKELEPTQDLWRRLENYQYREKQEKEAKALKEAAKADLLNLFAEHDAETLLIPNEDGQSWKLSYKEINKAEHIVNASSYRVFRLSEPK